VFDISEAGGRLTDLTEGQETGSRRCHAELHVEGPAGAWTARISSVIYDDPEGALWDEHQLLLVKYGFFLYAFAARTGDVAWKYSASTPLIALLTSARLDHVLLQAELETVALREDGSVAWHVTHEDVIAEARLFGGRLDLTSYTGTHLLIDARTGTAA
jgi:outer membrane protein assembly factor BamB